MSLRKLHYRLTLKQKVIAAERSEREDLTLILMKLIFIFERLHLSILLQDNK